MADADHFDILLLASKELANSLSLGLDGAGRSFLHEDVTVVAMLESEKDEIEYKPSYISGDYYARNNVNSDKVDMTCTEKALGTGYTFTFKYADIEGYEVNTIKCSASSAVIDVADDKTVTVTLNADDLNKDTFSVMVIYRKVD